MFQRLGIRETGKKDSGKREEGQPTLRHLAMIMDGNGRWAERRALPRSMGHQAGLEAMRRIIRCASEFGIEVLTLYAFSTENWSRPREEVDFLMSLPIRFLEQDLPELMKNNVKVIVSGREAGIPAKTWHAIEEACTATAGNSKLIVNLAFNYGGRAELVDAIRELAEDYAAGRLTKEQIDELAISARLYHPELAEPDLIVRAAGERRLSNFLLWQSAYSEFYFSDKSWPDFDRDELERIVTDYRQRERRFGGLSK